MSGENLSIHSPNPAARQAALADAAHADPAQHYIRGGFAPGGHRTAPLTLEEQRQIITRGESVLWNNQIIDRHDMLPSEAVLALGDPVKEQAAADKIQKKIDTFQAELDELKSGRLQPPMAPPGVGPGSAPIPPSYHPASTAASVAINETQQAEIKEAQRKALLANARPVTETPGV